MGGQTSERGLATAPIRRTGKQAVADLINIPGLRFYVYPDGHMNLSGREGGYPFDSITEFVWSLSALLRKLELEARRPTSS